MTTSDSATRYRYEGNGVTDTFSFPARLFSQNDLVVEIITRATDVLEETLTISADYSVNILSEESAEVVTVGGKIPTATQDIQVRRAIARTQSADLPTGTSFPSSDVENALDRTVAIVQEIGGEVDRAVKLTETSSLSNIELPTVVAGELIGWNATGDNLTTYDFANISTSLDVILSTVTGGDFLQYNGVAWENRATPRINNLEAAGSSGAVLRSEDGTECMRWGVGNIANVTLKGDMSGDSTYKITDVIDPTAAQDVATKNYVDTNTAMVLLGEYTASNVTSVDIGDGLDLDAVIDGSYDRYILEFINLIPSVNSELYLRTSSNSGVSFDSGAGDYHYRRTNENQSTAYSASASGSDTQIELSNSGGIDSAGVAHGSLYLFSPSSSQRFALRSSVTVERGIGSTSCVGYLTTGARASSTEVDAIRLYMSSGNIASGTFKLYGVK